MKCLSCGAELDDDSIFCSSCGKKVGEPDTSPEIIPDFREDTSPVADENNIRFDGTGPFEEVKNILPENNDSDDNEMPEAIFADSYDNTVAAIDEALEALNTTIDETQQDIVLPEPETESPEPEAALPEPENKVPESVPAEKEPVITLPEPEPAPVVPEPEPVIPEPESKKEEVPESAPIPPLVKAPKPEPEKHHHAPPVYEEKFEPNTPPPAYNNNYEPNTPPPVYSEPVQPEYIEEVTIPKKKVGAIRLTGAGLLAIFTTLVLISLSLLFCIKIGVTGDILQKRTKKMDINTVLDADYNGRSLSDAIYNEAGFGEATQEKVSKSDFRTYLSKTDLLAYAGGFIKDYADYILIGESSDPSVTSNELADFFINNSDVADDTFDYQVKISDYNKVRSNFEAKGTADNFSIDKWSNKINFELENANFIFSYVTLGIILGLVIVLLIWIIVAVDKRGKHVVSLYGSVFAWSGTVMALVGLAVVAGASIAHVITGEFVFYLCASLLLPFGVFALCIGAGELLIGFIFKRIRTGIRNKEKRNKAVEKALAGTAV